MKKLKYFNKYEFVPRYNRDVYEIVRNYCKQEGIHKDGMVFCPKYNYKDIIMQKGERHIINGLDEIAIICNKCKKVYESSDVNYYPSCPKDYRFNNFVMI